MNKNLMPEVARMLGVELGEIFITNDERITTLCGIYEDGLCRLNRDGSKRPGFEDRLLRKLLRGDLEAIKLPWEPKMYERYYYPSLLKKEVVSDVWWGRTSDCTLKVLGMVYRTEEEAKEHLAEDYERLTGKKLGEQDIVKIPWEPKRGESYYAMSSVDYKIACYDWNGSAADYECLKKGLVHKTQSEAEEHFAEDYKKLTGRPFSSIE